MGTLFHANLIAFYKHLIRDIAMSIERVIVVEFER